MAHECISGECKRPSKATLWGASSVSASPHVRKKEALSFSVSSSTQKEKVKSSSTSTLSASASISTSLTCKKNKATSTSALFSSTPRGASLFSASPQTIEVIASKKRSDVTVNSLKPILKWVPK